MTRYLLLFLLTMGVIAAAAETEVYGVTSQTVPGGVVFVTAMLPDVESMCVHWGTTTVDGIRRADGTWEVLLGVPASMRPGSQTISIITTTGGHTTTCRTAFSITKRTFPIQRLRMSRTQEAKYTAPSVKEEYRLIGAALRREPAMRMWTEGFRLPVTGRLATAFGTRRIRNGKQVGTHKGVDLAAPEDTPVYAANAGTVTLRHSFGLHGNTLVVAHGAGVAGLYLHLSQFCVKEGDTVQAGQLLGRVGHTGAATGPHLHYALYVHGTPIDPLLLRTIPVDW